VDRKNGRERNLLEYLVGWIAIFSPRPTKMSPQIEEKTEEKIWEKYLPACANCKP